MLHRVKCIAVVQQVQTTTVQTAQKAAEIPQEQFSEKVVDPPLVVQHQAPMVQKVQMTHDAPQLSFIDDLVYIPVVALSEMHMVEKTLNRNRSETAEYGQKMIRVTLQSVKMTQTS